MATEACWCLCSFERRVGTCVTHKLTGFAVGWEFLLLRSSVFWASVQRCWGVCMRAGMRAARRRNEELKHLPSVDGVQQSFREQTGGEKKSNLSEILFWAYCISVHGAPRAEVRSFLFYLLLSAQAWAFSLFLIFSDVFLWNWMWKTQLAWFFLFCEPWSWQYGVFVWVTSACLLRTALSLYKQPITSGWSGFPMGCQVSFSLKWNSGLFELLGPALLRKERKDTSVFAEMLFIT